MVQWCVVNRLPNPFPFHTELEDALEKCLRFHSLHFVWIGLIWPSFDVETGETLPGLAVFKRLEGNEYIYKTSFTP